MSRNTQDHACIAHSGARNVVGREFDELIDRLFYSDTHSKPTKMRAPISIWEEGEHFHIELELPGVSQDAIEITFDKGQLNLSARRDPPESEDRKMLYQERSFGEVTRSLTIPEGVDTESIEASFSDGLLRIVLSKLPEILPRKIPVKTA